MLSGFPSKSYLVTVRGCSHAACLSSAYMSKSWIGLEGFLVLQGSAFTFIIETATQSGCADEHWRC